MRKKITSEGLTGREIVDLSDLEVIIDRMGMLAELMRESMLEALMRDDEKRKERLCGIQGLFHYIETDAAKALKLLSSSEVVS